MPELPEVEMYKRYVERHALRQKIAGVTLRDRRIAPGLTPARLRKAIVGCTLTRVTRHGKHVFIHASGGEWLHLHFGMSGDIACYESGEDAPKFARVVVDFVNGMHLAYDDPRLFGRVGLTPTPEEFISERRLGPDALDPDLDAAVFRTMLARKRGMIKALLLSQEVIAGVGNLYADEILFQTGIHPRTPNERLDGRRRGEIFKSMQTILRDVIAQKERGAPYPNRYLISRRESGESCPRCGGEIERTTVMARTTYFCAKHQKTG